MERLVDATDQVRRHKGERQATIELECRRTPVELQIKAGLPRTVAGVTRRQCADLRLQTGTRRVARRRQQLGHAGDECRITRRRRIENEGTVVSRTVAVDIGAHQRRERRTGAEATNRRDLEARCQRMCDGRNDVVLAIEPTLRPLAIVRVAGCGG